MSEPADILERPAIRIDSGWHGTVAQYAAARQAAIDNPATATPPWNAALTPVEALTALPGPAGERIVDAHAYHVQMRALLGLP
jgi:hypothetical protein